MQIATLANLNPFTTLDGSTIRELAGLGRMRLGEHEADIAAGQCVVIVPGTPHKLWNTGPDPLVLLCCCAPAYSDEDTVMTGR